jgi:pyruvate formate lyase activating enzyme
MDGMVFDIQRMSMHDGPGLRTSVFLKGCPLNCSWCHNPESKKPVSELFYQSEKCVHCGACAVICKCHHENEGRHSFDRNSCTLCFKCTEVCPSGALSVIGKKMTIEEVLTIINKDILFYKASGGGVTLSGGEPLFQPDFTTELAKSVKELGLHTAIETSGFALAETLEKILPYIDLFLYDIKEIDPQLHCTFTNQDNTLILNNLKMISNSNKKVILRCPIIPGLNDRIDHFKGIAMLANCYDAVQRIDLEPYHPLGAKKCEWLGMPYPALDIALPTKEDENSWIAIVSRYTNKEVYIA